MEHPPHIVDGHGRTHDYLRISLTERCNLRCFYCMPEEGVALRDKAEFMTAEETIAIAKEFVALGVKKIRLTGGEPLIKRNAALLIEELGKLPVELTLTTNAVIVDRYIDVMKKAGITSINVSLDSLVKDRFNDISRRNFFPKIVENIALLRNEGFKVKINVVVIRGVNDQEIVDFVQWSKDEDVHVRFIEFMPFDGNNWNWDKKVSFKEIIDQVTSHFGASKLQHLEMEPNATARTFQVAGSKGTFGIISTVTNPFCDTCNRIRLTADGKIKNCLFSSTEFDLLSAHRRGEDLRPIIHKAIGVKEKERGGNAPFTDETVDQLINRSMTAIGG